MDIRIILLVLIVACLVVYMWRRPIMILGAADVIKNLKTHPRSKSEHAVVQYFEQILQKPFPTTLPEWLQWRGKRLELDGYNEELNLAVEFSGPLHTKWYPQRETYKKYYNRLVNDAIKRELCKKHGTNIIVVDMSLPTHHWRTYILSRLSDLNMADRPINYINEQIATPFRNLQLERELKLDTLDHLSAN